MWCNRPDTGGTGTGGRGAPAGYFAFCLYRCEAEVAGGQKRSTRIRRKAGAQAEKRRSFEMLTARGGVLECWWDRNGSGKGVTMLVERGKLHEGCFHPFFIQKENHTGIYATI